MDALARRDADHFLPVFAQQHALLGQPGFGGGDADDVALRDFGIETEQQVGRGQMEEVQRVRLQDLAEMQQPRILSAVGVNWVAPTIMSIAFDAAR